MYKKWTYEKCKEEALKYKRKVDFQKNSGSAYQKCISNGWLDDLCSHMEILIRPREFWTKEMCLEEAIKYNKRSDFQRSSPRIYRVLVLNGWLDEICSHMIQTQNPRGYWTKERCEQEANKYNTRTKFQKKSSSAYNVCLKNGWLDELCSHMDYTCNPRGYWNQEKCLEEALKYKTYEDFKKKSNGAYNYAYRNGFLYDIIDHLKRRPPVGYWSYERCKEEALKYTTLLEFRKSSNAYSHIINNGWKDELFSHMEFSQKPKGYYSYEVCRQISRKYNSRSELQKQEPVVYSVIRKNGWKKEMFSHMRKKASFKKRYIYAFKFPDNHIYIGLTYNPQRRISQHLSKCESSAVKKHIDKTGLKYDFELLYKEPMDMEIAGEKEIEMIEYYKSLGWNILNIASGGSLGGMKPIWTYEKCEEICAKYSTMSELLKELPRHVLTVIYSNGWETLLKNIEEDRYIPWNEELVLDAAKKCKTIAEFQKKYSGGYKAMIRLNMHEQVKSIMPIKLYLKDITKEECVKIASQYKYLGEFRKKNHYIASICAKNGWWKDVTANLVETPPSYSKSKRISWTYQRCEEEVKKFNHRCDLEENSKGCYSAIVKNKWNELFSHMVRKPRFFKSIWTIEKIEQVSKTCKHRSEFQEKYSGAFKVARKLNLLDELFPNMKKTKKLHF